MAQVETTLETESLVARSPNHVTPGLDDRSAQNPAAKPKSPVVPSGKTKDGVRTAYTETQLIKYAEDLQTAAGGAGASSGSNAGRPSRAEDHEQGHAKTRHGLVASQQASPPPTTGFGSRIAGQATNALEIGGVLALQGLPQPETERGDTVVIPDSDNESEGQADYESGGAKPAEQAVERRTRRTNAPASTAPSRPKRGARSTTVLSSTGDAAGETSSIGKPTGMTELIGSAKGRKPRSDSDNDGLPKSGSKTRATSFNKGKNTTESAPNQRYCEEKADGGV
ncbi:hypothetical protein BM221_005759 [Beauveria bassiana]|uniref:Uncharacterized protein n=1 Tax=Beauveria bassiana TaxID=176275 RepID=A0A2N6NPI0_BEABA|nr:hypothetical protein BM221_005759 [Beauveria bassiana]